MRAIVTVRLPRKPEHDPKHKRTGKCPLFCPPFTPFELQGSFICTDATGEHHSYIESGENLDAIKKKAEAKYGHVTRIEEIP
jgi:hypothetical protein